ncbi:small multi-drug export protein [Evansella sp. AB-P1]|uniref:small multi-drug export protein n=1 Tax=Evansella sp. AB-P1 TaxID=3037653 RepID=UPI00241F6E6F|nr:small multi-drug export protein [Evansella sp. AB-P1]MDG5786107.1 small multi-drug export protein [Evansella sp. AB-P1]
MLVFEVLWQYILLFVMAATPWLEILIVIPIGIALGLPPIPVAIVSFIGNFLPIVLIVYLFNWVQQTNWYVRRKKKKEIKKQEQSDDANNDKKATKKERASAIFHKYGLPGLAILGPIVTGIHLAAIIALSLKANKSKTTIWMGLSLILWTIVITVGSFYSIDWLTGLF